MGLPRPIGEGLDRPTPDSIDMDSTPGAANELLDILRLAGPEWTDRRQWDLAVARSSSTDGAIRIENPAFCYFWEIQGSRIETSFVAGGGISPGPGRTMIIEVGKGLIRVHIPGRKPLVIGAIDPATYGQIVDLVNEAQSSQPGAAGEWQHELRTIGCAMRLIALTCDAALAAVEPDRPGRRSARKDQLVSELHEWLRPNLRNSIKLADAARHFDKSPRQLIRILKETTGAGFAEHLTMHRLTLARSLLMRTDQSVMEVARASGFNSREQFIRSFSKAFDWTPLQFRKAWNRASLSEGDLAKLCQVSGRTEVKWLSTEDIGASPAEEQGGEPNTVVVANALHEIVELFWVTPHGKLARIDILESGGMVFVNRDQGRSVWRVRATGTGRARSFMTPDDHACAVISSDALEG